MAHIFLSDLKATLDNCIAEVEEIHFMFCKNPESDFTRNRRLSSHDLPESEFDTYIRTTLIRHHTKETLGNPDPS